MPYRRCCERKSAAFSRLNTKQRYKDYGSPRTQKDAPSRRRVMSTS
jgi:hypothetical protein